MYQYKAVITNVVDGDTFDMDIDLGFHIHIHERVRLLDVDTPEKFGSEKIFGLIVRQYAIDNFLGKEVIINSEKENVAADTDSFGRWLVRIAINGADVCDYYNMLGINKMYETYSEENVARLAVENEMEMNKWLD